MLDEEESADDKVASDMMTVEFMGEVDENSVMSQWLDYWIDA